MLAFKASFINSVTVQHIANDKNYADKEVSFVRLNPRSNGDMSVFDEIKRNWKTNNTILGDMYSDMCDINTDRNNILPKSADNKAYFYALTTQDKRFRNLDAEKILGVSEFTDNSMKFGYVDFIQVNPKYIRRKNMFGEYRGIGESLMRAMINRTKMKNIYLNSLPEIVGFYKKLGFIIIENAIKQPLMLLKK